MFSIIHKRQIPSAFIGTAVGLIGVILCFLYAEFHLGFDRQWGADSYRIESRFEIPGRAPIATASAPGPLKAALESYFGPDIQAAARLWLANDDVRVADRTFETEVGYVDPDFLEIFPLRLLAGDWRSVLEDPTRIALAASEAKRIFGDRPAVGHSLDLSHDGRTETVIVGAIFEDPPLNSHLELAALRRFDESAHQGASPMPTAWTSANMYTYVELGGGVALDRFRAALQGDFEAVHMPVIPLGEENFDVAESLTLTPVPVRDIHLRSETANQIKPPGDLNAVRVFLAVGLLILALTGLNFSSLVTASLYERAHEIGLHKLFGATRFDIGLGLVRRCIIFVGLAAALAVAATAWLHPSVASALGESLGESLLANPGRLWLVVLATLILSALAAIHPALRIASLRPVRVLRQGSSIIPGGGKAGSLLTALQFAVASGLIAAASVILLQMLHTTDSRALGYDTDSAVVFRDIGDLLGRGRLEAYIEELRRHEDVEAVARSSLVPTDPGLDATFFRRPGESGRLNINVVSSDPSFFDVYGIPVLSGRPLSSELAGDRISAESLGAARVAGGNALVNAAALSRLGFMSPDSAVGETVMATWSIGGEEAEIPLTIVGVVGNAHFASMREAVQPAVFVWDSRNFTSIAFRAAEGKPAEALSMAEETWRRMLPDVRFPGVPLGSVLAEAQQSERAQLLLIGALAVLATFLACLGLYGFAATSAGRRLREYSVRKILGASSWRVFGHALGSYARPVLAGNLIALPIAALLMARWLEGFVVRIDLSALPFAIAVIACAFVALVTTVGQAVRVSRIHPGWLLRSE